MAASLDASPAEARRRAPGGRALRYGLSLAAVALACWGQWGLAGAMATPFILFVPAVMATAWLGGLAAGLVATAVTTAFAAAVSLPAALAPRPLGAQELAGLGLYVAVATAMSATAALYHRSRERAARSEAEAARLRAVEEALRRYQVVATSTRDVILVVRRDDRRILEANPAAGQMYGYTEEELRRLTIDDLRAEPDPEALARQVAEADARGIQFETVHLRKDGTAFPVEVSSQGATLDGARVLIAIVRDVTEARRAQGELRLRETRFRALIERSTDLLVVLDAAGACRFWSQGAVASLGWTPEEQLGRPGLELLHPEDRDRAEEELRRVVAAPGEAITATFRFRHQTGAWRELEVTARSLLADPAVQGVVVNARDVTDARRLEAQLRQAQKLESIGRLAGGVAHDFNNLLTVILGCAEALREAVAQGVPATAEEVEELRTAGRRASELTRQLLAFARRQVIAPVPLVLSTVVRNAQRLLQRLLGEDVDLVILDHADLWRARCDPGQLEQVILNLAVNARDAMPRGGVLTLETANAPGASDGLSPPADCVRLTIRDSGVGMTPEVQAHLFEPFFTTKPVGQGTGLGLATVYGIVQQAGGHIRVESHLGQGTAFHLYFPRTEALPAAPAAPAVAGGRGSEALLVVEDDAQVREVTVRALRAAGYDVTALARPQAALELPDVELARVRLLVTDVVMPGVDGRALADELARRRPGLRVLFVSGYSGTVIADRGVLESGVQFLAKPFTGPELLARVRAVLDG